MKTLESQRAHYLKCVEAAGNVEVMEAVKELETKLSLIDKEKCKKEYETTYIRSGSFHAPYTPLSCTTAQSLVVSVPKKDAERVKEYFKQRNPEAFVVCYPLSNLYKCEARLKPETFFQ
jgi:hypothetical protein